jgi:hypothetical protein
MPTSTNDTTTTNTHTHTQTHTHLEVEELYALYAYEVMWGLQRCHGLVDRTPVRMVHHPTRHRLQQQISIKWKHNLVLIIYLFSTTSPTTRNHYFYFSMFSPLRPLLPETVHIKRRVLHLAPSAKGAGMQHATQTTVLGAIFKIGSDATIQNFTFLPHGRLFAHAGGPPPDPVAPPCMVHTQRGLKGGMPLLTIAPEPVDINER